MHVIIRKKTEHSLSTLQVSLSVGSEAGEASTRGLPRGEGVDS